MAKRWAVALAVGVLAIPGLAGAEPIGGWDQAGNVTGLAGIEAGVEFDYSYEKFEQDMSATIENSVTEIPVFVRLGLPILEAKLTIPYGNLQSNIAAVEDENYSGIQNIGLGIKTGLLALPFFNFALGLNTVFPTAEPEKYIFGQGLAINPFVAADVDILIMKLHANLNYAYRAEYEISVDTGGTVDQGLKLKPGDALQYALGAEIPVASGIFLMAELIGTSYQDIKQDSITVPDTAGSTFVLVPGIRLQNGILKAKLGMAIPLEKQEDRPLLAPRADWRLMGGVSLLLGI